MKYALGEPVDYEDAYIKPGVDILQFDDLEVVIAFETLRELKERLILNVGIGGSIIAAPVLYKGVLYFGCADKSFYAVSDQGKKIWSSSTEAQLLATARISEDVIYFGSYDGNFYALGIDGRPIWSFGSDDIIISTPCINKKRVYFGSCDGKIYCLDTRTGRELWRFMTGGPIVNTPFFADGRLYFGSDDMNYYSVDERGNLLWRFHTNDKIVSTASFSYPVYKNIIYFSSYDFKIYAVTMKGNLVWMVGTNDHIYPVTVHGDQIYFGCRDGNLYCLDAKTGSEHWKFATGGYVATQPLVYNDRIYFGSGDSNLYCTTLNGKKLWSFSTGGPVVSSPTADDKAVYFGSWDCNLYAVSHEGKLLWKFSTNLGYQSPIDIESPNTREVTHQVVWSSKPLENEGYEKRLPDKLSDYGDGLGTYQSIGIQTTYMSGPEKAYKSKRKYG